MFSVVADRCRHMFIDLPTCIQIYRYPCIHCIHICIATHIKWVEGCVCRGAVSDDRTNAHHHPTPLQFSMHPYQSLPRPPNVTDKQRLCALAQKGNLGDEGGGGPSGKSKAATERAIANIHR